MRRVALVLLFVLMLFGTLLFQTPLSRLQPWFPQVLQNGERFTGTLFRGGVLDLNTVNGLVDLNWVYRPATLLSAALGANVEFEWDTNVEGEARVAVGLGRQLKLHDVLVAGGAQQLDKMVLPGVLQFGGDIRVDVASATVAERVYGPVDGIIEWMQASITGQIAVSLGDIKLTMSEDDGDTLGQIQNAGGDVALSGTFRLTPDGAYQTDILAVPSPGADQGVRFTLQSIGTPESGDGYRIRESGNLADLV